MANTLIQKDGRKWGVDYNGISTLKRKYVIQLDANNLGANGETATFAGLGLPAIGSAHPNHAGLRVQNYEIEEGEGKDKRTLTVFVNYARNVVETSGEGQQQQSFAVDEWGWDAGTEEKELTTAADGTVVLNSAGDPFDSVPQVSAPAPVFTKVMKFAARQSGAMAYSCKVNDAQITIGDMTCPAGSLLCTVAEKRIIGDANWMYQYTIQLKYKSNPVKLAAADATTDIGWDVAITDAGMREKVSGKLKLIRQVDSETGKLCTVTSPELLNGQGAKVDRSGAAVKPYNFRFKAYPAASFPGWFYSEPSAN